MSKQDFTIILNCSFDAGLLVNEAGTILHANNQALKLFGIDNDCGIVGSHITLVFLFGSTTTILDEREIHTWQDLMDLKRNYNNMEHSSCIEFTILCKDKASGSEFLGQVKFAFLSNQSALAFIKKNENNKSIEITSETLLPRILERDNTLFSSGASITLQNFDVETMTGTLDSWQKECVLSSIMKISVDPLFQINSSGIIYLVNDAALQVFGFRRRELIGKNIRMIVGGGHANKHDKYLQNFLQSGVAKVMGKKRQLLARRKDGTEFPIELTVDEVETFSGDERLFCGFVHDLSEIKAKEREILHRQQLFSQIIECSMDSIFQINSIGIIEIVNQAAIRLFGYQDKSDMIGKNISMIVGAAHADNHDMYLRRYLETGDARVIGKRRELPARRKDGTEFPIELSIMEIQTENGRGKLFAGFVYDLTAKKRFIAMEVEKTAAETLLMNVLPDKIARRLLDEQQHIAESHENAAILFADIVGFTEMSQVMSPTEVVQMLNELFSTFDTLVERYALNKIKTIGDCYMVTNVPPHTENMVEECSMVCHFALDLVQALRDFNYGYKGKNLDLRVGLNIGDVVAGVVGTKRFLYDLWGDAVNTASRMESTGIAGKVQVTEAVVDLLRGMFTFEPRGPVAVKGKGIMSTYFLTGRIEPRPPSRQQHHDVTGIPDTIYLDKPHAKLTLFEKLRDLQLALAADEEMNLNPDVGCVREKRSKSLIIRRTLSDEDFDTDSQSI